MARQNAPLLAFNRGEVSKDALARTDLVKLQLAAECQLNWLPQVIGPMMVRPGFFYVGEILNDNPAKLMRFVFSKLDTALIELTASNMRVWVNEALITRVSVGTTISDPFFAGGGSWTTSNTTSGASATITGGVATLQCIPVGGLAQIQQTLTIAGGDQGKEHALRVVITAGPVIFRVGTAVGGEDLIPQTTLDTGTHSLAFTPLAGNATIQIESTDGWQKTLTQCSIEAAGVMVLPTPWAVGDLPNIRYDQSGDIIYIACRGQQQQKIERRAAHSWSVVLYYSNTGPFNPLAGIQANLTLGAFYGNTTMTSDRPWFLAGHVGAIFRLFLNGQTNQTVLGAQNTFSTPVRVSGTGTGIWSTANGTYQVYVNSGRNYTITVTGSFVGTLQMQRSLEGPLSGFADVPPVLTLLAAIGLGIQATDGGSLTAAGTLSSVTGTAGAPTDLDNVVAWERVGFKAGAYTSGTATISTNYTAGGGFVTVRVTGYTSPTQVNVAVLEQTNQGYFPATSLQATTQWVETQWSNAAATLGVGGFPTSVAFHEGRLGWFGAAQMWLSAADNFTNFADQNADGTPTGEGGAINETLGSGPVDTISWGLSLTRLLLGREQSIMSARSSNFDQPLTPTQIVIRDCSDQGAQRLPAIKAGKRGVYVQQSGRKVYELAFNAQEMDYDERDLTRLNLEIGKPGFTDIDKVTQPDKLIFLPRTDGQCAALLYDVKDEVEAWWRIQTLGIIENVAVLPQNDIEDLVYFVVRRVINGVTKRFIEKLAPRTNCVGGTLNQLLDCHTVYNGSPASSITLSQLPNTTVSVWADGTFIGTGTTNSSGVLSPLPDGLSHSVIVAGLAGSVQTYSGAATTTFTGLSAFNGLTAEVFADQQPSARMVRVGTLTVSGGTLTLPANWQATTIVACFGFVAPFMSAKLAYAAQMGSPLAQKKKIDHVGLVMFDTHAQGIQAGQRFDHLDSTPLYEEGAAVTAGTVWSEYDEPMIEVAGEWDTDARLCLLAQAPFPCKVGGAVVAVMTNEKS